MRLYIIENPLAELLEKVRFIRCYQIYIDIWGVVCGGVYSSLYDIYYCVKGTLCDIKTISKTRLFHRLSSR